MKLALPKMRMLRYGLAIVISVFVARYFHLAQAFWVPLTTAIVLQATAGATLRKGLQRFVGTLLGILLGTVIVYWIHNIWVIQALLILTLFIAYYLKAFNLVNYGIFVVPLSMMVVMLVSTLVPKEASILIFARFYDTTIGAVIAVLMSLVFFPKSQLGLLAGSVEKTKIIMGEYLNSYRSGEQMLRQKRDDLENCLTTNRTLYADAFYELLWIPKKRKKYKQFLLEAEKLNQLLIGFEQVFIQANPELKVQILKWLKKHGTDDWAESKPSMIKNKSNMFLLYEKYRRAIEKSFRQEDCLQIPK